MSKKNTHLVTFGIVLLASTVVSRAQVDGSWEFSGSGDWSDATKWSSDPAIPGGAGSTVSLERRGIIVQSIANVASGERTLQFRNGKLVMGMEEPALCQ